MGFDLETILGILFFVVFVILPIFGKRKGKADEAAPRPGEVSPEGSRRTAQEGRDVPGGSAARPQAGTSTRQAQGRGNSGSDPVQDALEEIRARVREAQLQEDARRRGGASSSGTPAQPRRGRLVSSDPFEKGLVTGEPVASAMGREGGGQARQAAGAPGGLGREGGGAAGRQGAGRPPSGAQRPPAPGGLGREGYMGSPIESSAPLEVTRHRRRPTTPRGRALGETASSDGLPAAGASAARLDTPALLMDRRALVTGMIWHEVLSEPAARKRLRRTRSRPR